uniref:Uncharacterized protein n=1 Tax=Klebsiella phage vB_KpnM_Iguana_ER37 TaxID=3076781 RepID=A0AB38Z3U0_9CAUD
MTTKITVTYYIDSGKLNAMYTLRRRNCGGGVFADSYICNLSTDPQKAENKAKEYFDRVTARIANTENFEQVFAGYADFELGQRRGKLSIVDTARIEEIEAGRFPFGKHCGKTFADVTESYVLFFADMANKPDNGPVMEALSAACLGYALDHGYIAARDQKRAERKAEDLKSNWIGNIGDRLVFEGEIVFSYLKIDEWNQSSYYIIKVRQGDDLVTYIGSKEFGPVGAVVKFKATVKKHDIYQDVKTTVVNRPALVA